MFYKPDMMDALADYNSARYIIFGVPFDATSSYRPGSRWAPDAMRKASANFETYNEYFDIDFEDLLIHDIGNLEPYSSVDETLEDLYHAVRPIVKDGKIPILMGGEHSLTYPCVKACSEEIGEDIGFVVMDAHFDLREEYGGIRNNHACVSRHVHDDITDTYVTIGVRSGPKEEWAYAKENDLKYYTSDDVREMGIKMVISEVKEYLGCKKIYLSLDMDALDPAYAPGLGTPEPFGLTDIDVREVIRELAPHSIGFDVVEIAPEYDNGISALLGTKLLREFIAAHAASER
ncbi:agmatinase [Methanolobus bombayensis]|uniref:agmatinase n=1 Tax=Methanolobus bombayensis TaxID=38023 RepID=UPI001AE535FB|nr:agmatinase [Methanolobus bombayensis]MBP1909692.1 agmatinase [Methanolobus bombayensis]